MGNKGSKNRIKQDHAQDVEDDRRRQIEAGEQRKRELDAQRQREIQAQREQNQKAIEEEARKNFERVNAEIAEMEKYKQKQQDEMAAWRAKAREQAAKENEQMEAQAKIEMDKRLKEHAAEEAKLEKKLEALNEARAELLRTADEAHQQRIEMQIRHKELTDQQTKEHNEYIRNKLKEVNDHTLQRQQDFKAVQEAGREKRLELQNTRLNMITNTVQGGTELINKMDADSEHDLFRLKCDALRMHFKNFQDAYGTQDPALKRTVFSMRWKKELKDLPREEVVTDEFESFNRAASTLGIPDNLLEKLRGPLDEILKGARTINDAIASIEGCIEGYMTVFENKPYSEEDKEQMKECHAEAKENMDLISETVPNLVKLMRNFNIPVSREAIDEVNRQTAQLTMSVQNMLTSGSGSQKAVEN